jgi:hypothetical protein
LKWGSGDLWRAWCFLIADHDDTFNARFITFLVEYVSLEEIKLTLTKELAPLRRSGALSGR